MSWSIAGAAVGGAVGSLAGGIGLGPGAQLGATIGALVDGLTAPSPANYSDRRYSSCSYGTPINRVWGSARVDCQVIWVQRNSDGSYMTETDEGKKGSTTQHWFATFAFNVAEIGLTFPDGEQIEYKLTVNRIWMGDIIAYANPSLYSNPWASGVTYNYGDIVLASTGYYYQSLEDGNLNLNPAGDGYPAQWQKISSPTVTISTEMHPGPSESTFTMAASSTITTQDGIGSTSANRGNFYVVALNMDLYGIGNSIPSNISCEVSVTHLNGDAITDGDVLWSLCRQCGIPDSKLDFSALTNVCAGFVQNNRQSGQQAITNFCIAKAYDLTKLDGVLTAIPRGSASAVTIPDGDMGATLQNQRIEDRLPADVLADYRELHSSISVRYRSARQFFRVVEILSLRNDALTENPWQFDSGLSLSDSDAAQMACRLLDTEWLEANGKFGPVKLPDTYAYLAPGTVVTANDNGILTRFRITDFDWVPGMVTLQMVRDEIEILNQYATGDSGVEPILPNQLSVASFAIASPAIDATDALAAFPGFYVWVCTTPGNVPATVYYSFDNFVTAAIKGPTIVGRQNFGITQTVALADASAPGYETTSHTNVKYTVAGLMHADDYSQSVVSEGIQWALIGNEWVGVSGVGIASGGVQEIGTGLIRGLRGSSYTGHSIGEQFAMGNVPSNINSGNLTKVQIDPARIGQTVYVQVLTNGQTLGDNVVKSCVIASPFALTPVNPASVVFGNPSYSGSSEQIPFRVQLATTPPAGQSYNWQYSTDGGTTWSSSVISGTSYTPPSFASGTMMARAQAVLSTGQTGSWVNSSNVTYSSVPTSFSEIPAGAINGTNTAFILSHTPLPGTLHLYLNGLLRVPGTDYFTGGTAITMAGAPASGSTLYATYSY